MQTRQQYQSPGYEGAKVFMEERFGVHLDPARAWWHRLSKEARAAYLRHAGQPQELAGLPWQRLDAATKDAMRHQHQKMRALLKDRQRLTARARRRLFFEFGGAI